MKNILLSFNLAIALIGNIANAQDIDAVMRNASDRFNTQMPQRVEAITTISRVQYISDSKVLPIFTILTLILVTLNLKKPNCKK